MQTTNKATVQLVAELAETIKRRLEIQAQERSLKDAVKELMGDHLILVADAQTVVIGHRTKRTFDVARLKLECGARFVERFTRTEVYEYLEVKPTKRTLTEVNEGAENEASI